MLERLGFIGAGKMAQAHAAAALALGAEIVAVVNANPRSENLAAFRRMAPDAATGTATWRTHAADTDAWIVAAPWHVIPELAAELLASPLPMLIEKPLSLHGARFPTGAHEGNKFVSFNRRFYASVDALKDAIEQGTVKSVVVTASDMIDAVVKRHGEAILPYAMEMWSSHILDVTRYLLGDVEVGWHSLREGPAGYANVEAMLVAEHGRVPVHLSINADDPSPVGLRVRMSDGTTHVLAPVERLTSYRGVDIREDEAGRTYQPREVRRVGCSDDGFKPGVREQMQAFLQQDHRRLATVADAHRLHDLITQLGATP